MKPIQPIERFRLPNRRNVLRLMGTGLAVAPFLSLVRCSSSGTTTSAAGADLGAAAGNDLAASVPWAIGGTADLSAATKAYNPFSGAVSSCSVPTCSITLGPCYAPTRVTQDISDGLAGVPVRFALRLVDDSCNPVTDATVDVWHVMPVGTYSGESQNLAFCDGSSPSPLEAYQYFRGVRATDGNGLVDFYSCYPGWYSGRTIHLHLTIRRGAGDYTTQTEYLTTQLLFDDTITDDIFANASPYARSTQRDTNNSNDTAVAASAVSDYLFDMTKMPDGSLVCAKTIILRAATSESLCTAPGGSAGMGGDGGPPGGGGFPPDGGFGGMPPTG